MHQEIQQYGVHAVVPKCDDFEDEVYKKCFASLRIPFAKNSNSKICFVAICAPRSMPEQTSQPNTSHI